MAALTAARSTQIEEQPVFEQLVPMADNVKIWKGGMVAVDGSGLAHAAADTAGYKVVGIALESMDNTQTGHSAGSWPPVTKSPGVGNWVRVRAGCSALLDASGLGLANLFDPVYVTDDHTVGLTSTNLVPAGYIVEFQSSSVARIYIPPPNLLQPNVAVSAFATAAPAEFATVPVTHIAYGTNSIGGGSSTNISCATATDSSVGATALFHLDLTDLLSNVPAGKGLTVNGVTIFYSTTVAALTAAPTCAIVTQTFAAASTSAAAPTAAATAGGSITTNPASPTLTTPTAGQFYTVAFTLGTPLVLNNPLARAYAEIGFPCGVGTVVYLAGGEVGYSNVPL